jgi:hypothetical protein
MRAMPTTRGVRALAQAALLAGLAAACAKPPPPTPRFCSATPGAVRYDVASGGCGCVPDVPGGWQPAAPRGGSEAVHEKEPARIALRRVGTADFTEREVEAEVWSPAGGPATGVGVVTPPEWAVLTYPQDFPLGTVHRAGLYTVLWKVDGSIVACDGFVIERRPEVVAPALPAEPAEAVEP